MNVRGPHSIGCNIRRTVCLVVLWRFRYKLSLRDLVEMFLQRGISFTHEAVREWENKLAPLLSEALRKRRRGAVGQSWYMDETYVKVQGQWCYLYRAIDRDGNLVDVRLSDTRDLTAAEAFFRSAWTVTEVAPDRITTDGHEAYPRAIRNVFGDRVLHRTTRHLNNHLEQDHRGIKPRYRPTCGLKTFATAARFCRLVPTPVASQPTPLTPPTPPHPSGAIYPIDGHDGGSVT
jgi:putative transposase